MNAVHPYAHIKRRPFNNKKQKVTVSLFAGSKSNFACSLDFDDFGWNQVFGQKSEQIKEEPRLSYQTYGT